MAQCKRKKSNHELSSRIRQNKQRILKINDSIKQSSIRKTVLTQQIETDTDELCSRIMKVKKK